MKDGELEASDFLEPSRGRYRASRPYTYVARDHPLYPMAAIRDKRRPSIGRAMLTSRFIMATHMGRILGKYEEVYHLDGDSTNNDISNLKLVTPRERNKLNLLLRVKRLRALGLIEQADKLERHITYPAMRTRE